MGSLPAETGAHLVLIDLEQAARVYVADETTIYRSDNAGQIWQPAAQSLPEGGVTALALDPRQPQRLYAETVAGPLYLSEDRATSWRELPGTGTDVAT